MASGGPDFYHRQHTVTTPAGTPVAAPLVTDLSAGPTVLDRIEVRVPPGPSGTVGFRVAWSGRQLIPYGDTVDWIVGDGELLDFPIGLEIDEQLVVETYNTGLHDHVLYFRLTGHDVARVTAGGLVPILPSSAIEAAA